MRIILRENVFTPIYKKKDIVFGKQKWRKKVFWLKKLFSVKKCFGLKNYLA